MKTLQEIEDLKTNWNYDPCWDIECTEGFEEHKDELLAYRLKREAYWESKRESRVAEEMQQMGLTDRAIYNLFKGMEYTITLLEKRIEQLEQ